MKYALFRAISIRAAAFLLTLTVALGLAVGHYSYVNRQAVFAVAAFRGNLFCMKALYTLQLDVNAPGCEYRSCFNPIWGAAYGGYNDEIQFLLDRGADVNAKPKFRTSALMVAAYQGHESTVRLLLSNAADVNANTDGDTALSFARDKGHREIVELLRRAGAKDKP
jgi:ankyrin repeat protein